MDKEKVAQYWEEFKAGDKESFGPIYEFYSPMLTFFCLGKVKNIALAENFASEALIRTYSHQEPDKIKNIEQWLFTIARNLCITHIRSVKRQGEILSDFSAGQNSKQSPEVYQVFTLENMNQLIKGELNEEEYQLWVMHAEGYNNDEIATRFELNSKTIANRKSDIRSRLKRIFKKYYNSKE